MQPLGKQPSYQPLQPSGSPEAKAGPERAPASAVNAIMGRLGLARTQDEPPADEVMLTANLADPSWAVRVSAVQKLGKMGRQAPLGLLLAAIRDEQSGVRVAAARALSRNPRQAAISALVAALEDSEWLVRAEAVLALGELGELAPLEPLLAALQDKDETVRASAAKALGETGSAQALEPLNAALQDEDWSVREAVTLALAQLELEGQTPIPTLLNARMDRDPVVREAAETGLLRIYPEIVSVPPPPSDSLADWLERIEFPQSTVLMNADAATRSFQKKEQQSAAQVARKKRAAKSFKWSHKAMNAAEGVLAAVIITSLFVVWLAIETQPRSTQGQASTGNIHDVTFTTYRDHYSDVEKLAWSPDGQNIASSDIKGTVFIWQASTGNTLNTLTNYPQRGRVLALTWATDDAVLIAYAEPKEVQVVELMVGFMTQTSTIFHQDISSDTPSNMPLTAAWSSDRQTLAFDEGDGSIQISNVFTHQSIAKMSEKHTQYSELAWSPDDDQLASLSTTGLLEIWDAYTGGRIVSLTANHYATLAIWVSCGHYHDGMLLVDSSSTLLEWSYGHKDQQAIRPFLTEQAYNLASADNLAISALSIAPGNTELLLATSDGLIQTRNMLSGSLLYVYAGHSAQVNDIEWSPSGKHIATASMDTTVRVWQEV